MTNTQVTSAAVAVALAVIVALGLLFFGPSVFSPFEPHQNETALLTSDLSTTTMDQSTSSAPGALPTELTLTDVVVGTGATATAGSLVTVNYVGMLPDGTVFDASAKHGQSFTFPLGAGKVIRGWDVGVQGMKEGGKRRLIVPPADGYGSQGAPGVIPPNATLIFDIELLRVQ